MGNVRLPKPTRLGWCAAGGIALAAGTIMLLALHNPVLAVLIGVLAGLAFVLAGAAQETRADSAPAEPARVAVPAPRVEAVAAQQPVAVGAAVAATPSPLTDPLDQVSLLSAYLHEETAGYQPSYVPEAPTLVARVPGQTLTVTEPDPLATAFVTSAESTAAPDGTDGTDGAAWRIGMDILPQSRSSAAAVGNRLGSFRSAVVKARREAKPKPPPGRHRAG